MKNITAHGVLRRLAGLATASLLVLSTFVVLDDNVASEVAGRQASIGELSHNDTASGSLRKSTTTEANRTTTTSALSTPTLQSTSTLPATTAATTGATTALAPTTAPITTTPAVATMAAQQIPATVPHPKCRKTNCYLIHLGSIDDPNTPQVEAKRGWWNAPYIGTGKEGSGALPYVADSRWIEGDRIAYRCAYGFLTRNGEVIGRFTFVRASGYSFINDRYMQEGLRFWDGSSQNGTGNSKSRAQAYNHNWCDTILSQEYVPDTRPGQLPRVVFWQGGEVVEIRDYRTVSAASGIKFRVTDVTGPFTSDDGGGRSVQVSNRVTVVAYENDLPVVVVYYDALGSGQVSVDFP